jgi:hypothetical protein
MKNNAIWLAMLLTATLGVTGCNEPVKQDNNGKLISAAPMSNGYADFLVKWRNKDEDGDGILDELDDYPLDASQSSFELIREQEPNDNPSIATHANRYPPFKMSGAISVKSDNGDLFSFNAHKDEFYTLVLHYNDDSGFKPNIYFSCEDGMALNFGKIPINNALKIIAINVGILKDGKYHIGVNDIDFDGKESFTYNATIFIDRDGDALSDDLESAMGINNLTHDTDKDNIWDTQEYYLGYFDSFNFDQDDDGLPDWLDKDK